MGSSYFWCRRGFCNDGYFICCTSRGWLLLASYDSDALLNMNWCLLHLVFQISFIPSAHACGIEPHKFWSRQFLFYLIIRLPQICYFPSHVLKNLESPYVCLLLNTKRKPLFNWSFLLHEMFNLTTTPC